MSSYYNQVMRGPLLVSLLHPQLLGALLSPVSPSCPRSLQHSAFTNVRLLVKHTQMQGDEDVARFGSVPARKSPVAASGLSLRYPCFLYDIIKKLVFSALLSDRFLVYNMYL